MEILFAFVSWQGELQMDFLKMLIPISPEICHCLVTHDTALQLWQENCGTVHMFIFRRKVFIAKHLKVDMPSIKGTHINTGKN